MYPKSLPDLGVEARWLGEEKARSAYAYATQYGGRKRYGLDEDTVENIVTHHIVSLSVADAWLRDHMTNSGTVQIIFGDSEVCVVQTRGFLDHWQSIFAPGRDDAIVLHNDSQTVMFFWHEDEIEIGQRMKI